MRLLQWSSRPRRRHKQAVGSRFTVRIATFDGLGKWLPNAAEIGTCLAVNTKGTPEALAARLAARIRRAASLSAKSGRTESPLASSMLAPTTPARMAF